VVPIEVEVDLAVLAVVLVVLIAISARLYPSIVT
jgi:hypothetical protein